MAQDLNIYAKYATAGSSSNQIYQDCIQAGSSSQNATETAYPTNTNPTNTGYTYLSSNPTQSTIRFARTRTEATDAAAFMTKYPTSTDLHIRGQYTHNSSATTATTLRFARTAAITESNAIAAKYSNNTTKAGWSGGISPKQK